MAYIDQCVHYACACTSMFVYPWACIHFCSMLGCKPKSSLFKISSEHTKKDVGREKKAWLRFMVQMCPCAFTFPSFEIMIELEFTRCFNVLNCSSQWQTILNGSPRVVVSNEIKMLINGKKSRIALEKV